MALGGGTFLTQNKILPGAYVNVISKSQTSVSTSDRGTAAIALELDWGEENTIFSVTANEFIKNSLSLFGCPYSADTLKGIRDIFKNANRLYVFRLNGNGKKAENTFSAAKYSGTAGNSLKTVIEKNADDETKFVVKTYFYNTLVDSQTVSAASELVDNDYVVFKKDSTLAETAGTALTGGENGTADNAQHQAFLDALESYSFNAVGVVSDNFTVNKLYAAYAERLRTEKGIRFQAVVFGAKDTKGGRACDSESVVAVKNSKETVYWVLGVIAGTPVNKSALNKVYDGEFNIPAEYTQDELEDALLDGEFVLHKVGNELRVLDDINSLVSVSDEKGDIFKDNQTVRAADAVSNNVTAVYISKYLGKIPNDAAGRESFKGDILRILTDMVSIRAIEAFDENDITVEQGEGKKSVTTNIAFTVIGTMAKLYMTCVIE